MSPGEEMLHRLREVAERLLLDGLAPISEPGKQPTGLGELTRLFEVPRRATSTGLPPSVLLDGEVVHVPGVRTVLGEHPRLSRCRIKPIPRHSNILSIHGAVEGRKRRFRTGLAAGITLPRTR